MQAATDDIDAYLSGPFHAVDGWCSAFLWQAIEPLRQAMAANGPDGPVAEIGVFHGKFFIGLVKTMGAERGNTAIDVFDMQRFNLDGAGKGNLARLQANLASSGVDEAAIDIVRADSMALTREEIAELRRKSGGFSLFSVDGCHLAAHTVNDIRIAMELTLPHGIIFVDDYYNPSWPGVQEGVAKLYLTDYPRFVPLLFTSNKLFLCHISFHSEYLAAVASFVKSNHPTTRVKPVRRFGYETLTLLPDFTKGAPLAARAPLSAVSG
jgi:hypothetical protein